MQEVRRRFFRGYSMMIDQLEARLQLAPGQLSTVRMHRGPRYTLTPLSRPETSWKPSAKPKARSVWRPYKELKDVQRQINQLISTRFQPHPIAHAYARGRGIVTNARKHVGKEWLFHVDLVNFFGSIKEERVVEALRNELSEMGVDDIRAIANLCCHQGSLPQGAPSSPVLSNLVCLALDRQLQTLASELGLIVTRYSDDICFSSASDFLPCELATVEGRGAAQRITLGEPLNCLFKAAEFAVNFRKVRFQRRTERQQVTGLIVNDGINVPRECYRKVRGALRLWERYGLHEAARHCQPKVSETKFANSLRGFIDYVGHVTGRDKRHCRLLGQYEWLRARDLPPRP